MKRIILFLGVLAAAFGANAQTVNLTATNGLALDTISAASSEFLTIGATGKIKANGSTSFILTVTKISGTVAGTAVLQGSHNGSDWADVVTSYTITDGTQTKAFEYDKSKYLYYRIKVTNTTGSFSYKGTYYVTSYNF